MGVVLMAFGILGADYDMTESTPGDLDPHAVASVFKAYLRERMSNSAFNHDFFLTCSNFYLL
jgi:hypothetical protein